MKLKLLSLLVLCGFLQTASAQIIKESTIYLPATVFLTDIQGQRPSEEWNRIEIKGSPFLPGEWAKAVVTLRDNRSFSGISIRLNCVNNSIHYLTSQKTELVAPDGMIKEIVMIDSTGTTPTEFRLVSGFPDIGKNTAATFYERLVNGKAQLLKYTKKKLKEYKAYAGATEKEYVSNENYYVFANGFIKEWEKGKEFLLEILADKKEKVLEYIDKQKLKCKNTGDVELVLNYYNNLP